MKKRLLSLLLALVMILGMIPATSLTANAASEKDEINIIRLVGPKSGRYLDFECGVSLLGVKVDGIRWVDHTAGKKYEIAYPGTHEPVEVVAGHEYHVVIFMSTTDGSVFPDPDDITASIPGANSVSAGHVGGEGADNVCVTGYFTATQGDSDIIGVQASGDGIHWNKEGEAVLNLNMDSQAFLYDDGSIGPVEGTRMGSLYTDQALTKPATSMEMGKTYYFEYSLWHKSGEVNKVEDYYSPLDFKGFSNGTVIKTTTGGNNNFTMLCSIVYGDLNVDRVEAVGTGYGYDSAEGAYAPIFESIKAYNAKGIEFDYDGFTWSTPFYTKSSFSSANKLTSEPQKGETYYFGIYIDQYLDGMSYNYTGAAELMNNSVVTIPGFDVECVGFMEREMGSYLELTYAATKKSPEVYVGGVKMSDGDYLAVGATATRTTKPAGGYAYYKNGTLTLNNYSYKGAGYQYSSSYYAVIYSKNDLTLELIGNNTLTQTRTDSYSDMINVSGAKLTVGGDGKLTGTAGGYGLYAGKDITINGGTVEVSTHIATIVSYGDVIINGGDITAESEIKVAIYSKYDVTVNGGNVTLIGGNWAIDCLAEFTVAEGLKIRASTTADGELGEYVAANHNSYKKITIHSHNFGTAWKYKEADGHAHVCSFCGEHDTVIKHTPDISAPTEKQDQKCTVCGYVIAPSLGHIHKNNLTKVTAKPATCTSDGNSEYYSCSCGKYFKDASASTEIKDKNSVIIKASHSFGTDWGYQDENGHAHACVCGTHDELIPHTPGAEATETTPQKCTECGYIITPALNHVHNLTKISAKPATCTEEGNAEFYICDGCSDWFEDAEGNVKIEDKASVKLIATGHAFGDEFKSDENEHWYECACGEKKDVAAHNDENGDGKCDACGYSSASAETEPVVTTPSDNTETTAPDKTDDENKGGMPWWAILLIVVAVAGISVGVTVIVLKKKK